MEHIWNTLKPLVIAIVTWVCSMLSPVDDTMYLFMAAFIFNIIMGLVTAVNAKKERFSMKKFWEAFTQLIFYIAVVTFVYWAGKIQNDALFYETGTKWVTYVVLYAYALNIVKNGHILWPKNRAIFLLYKLLSTEVYQDLKTLIGIKK